MMAENRVRISDVIAPVFRPLHREIRDDEYSEYWLKGGRGSGKSSFIAIEIILGMMRHPGANAIVYRKVAATLRESVFEQLIWAMDILGVRNYFRTRVSPLSIEYIPTGQKIMFRGADDPTKSKSIKLSKGYFRYLWFEELAEFQGMDAVRTIKASVLRGTGEEHPITFCSYNPPVSIKAWVNDHSTSPTPGRRVHSSSYLDIPVDWLGEEFVAEAEKLKASNERAYRHMYLGEVTGTGGNVFMNMELRTITPEEIDTFGTFYNGLDFGFATDPDAFTRWHYNDKKRELYAVDEFYAQANSIDRLAEEVKKRCMRGVVRCDSADPRMISELKRRDVNAVGVKKGPGSVEHGTRWLQDLGKIVIDRRRTPNIAREFESYEYRMDRHENFIPDYPDKDNHTIDSARYAMEAVIAQRQLKTMSKSRLGF